MHTLFQKQNVNLLIPIAVSSRAWVWGRSLVGTAGSNPAGNMDVCLLCVLLSRRLCGGLITRPEKSYRVWCVWVGANEEPHTAGLDPLGLSSHEGKKGNLTRCSPWRRRRDWRHVYFFTH